MLIAVVKKKKDIRGAIDILNDRGDTLKTITDTGRNWSPTWSANGEYVAFLSDRDLSAEALSERRPDNDPFYQPSGHLFVINLRSGELKKITSGAFKTWMPMLSPDGTSVAFLSNQNSKGDLYLSPSRLSTITRLTHDKNWPLESALWLSESELLFNSYVGDTLDVFRLNLRVMQRTRVDLGAPKGSKAGFLSLSHDGKRLVFVIRDRVKDAEQGIINPQIFVSDLGGKSRQQLTFGADVNYRPSWSSDDQWVSFLRQVDTPEGPRADLYLIDLKSNKERLVAKALTGYPAWIPGKNLVVYTSYVNNISRLYIYDVNTAASKQIGEDGVNYYEPSTVR
jgi:Tol biopolymer transport system component